MSEPIEAKTAWVLGWEAGASTVTDILTELIAELRGYHDQVVCPCGCGFTYDTCTCLAEWPCEEVIILDGVEARLQEVQGE